eukprot:8440307-Lingulodinium_polyedra.AAC.1
MTARTTVCALKQLLIPACCKVEAKIKMVQKKLMKTRKKQPMKVSARNLYVGSLLKMARKKNSAQ